MARVSFEAPQPSSHDKPMQPHPPAHPQPPAHPPPKEGASYSSRPRTVGWYGTSHKFTETMINRFYHDNSMLKSEKSQRTKRYSSQELSEKLEASREQRERIHENLIRKKSRKKRIKELLKQGKRMQARLDFAATTIQRHARGYIVRQMMKEYINEREKNRLERQLVHLEDQVEDCWMNLNDRANRAATSIQRFFRSTVASREYRAIRAERRRQALEMKNISATVIQRGIKLFLVKQREKKERERKEFEDKVEALRQRHLLAKVKVLWDRCKFQWKTIRLKYARELAPPLLEDRPNTKEVFKRIGGGYVRQTSISDMKSSDSQPSAIVKDLEASRPQSSEMKVRTATASETKVKAPIRPASAKSWSINPQRETPPSYMSPTLSNMKKYEEEQKEVKKKKPPPLLRRKSLTRNTISRELKVRTTKRKMSEDDNKRWARSNSPLNVITQVLPPRPNKVIARIPSKFEKEEPSEESQAVLARELTEEPMESVSYYKPTESVSADLKTALADKFTMPLDYWLSFMKKKPNGKSDANELPEEKPVDTLS